MAGARAHWPMSTATTRLVRLARRAGGLVYARRPMSSPPMVVRAVTPERLRKAIEAAEAGTGPAVSAVEDQAAALRAKHGERWKIWYVPLALGGYTWCARIHGDDLRNVVHADTAEHLDEHIRLREEDLAADAALSDEAARDLDDGDVSTDVRSWPFSGAHVWCCSRVARA